MNEIALANFYRVLNNEDRFPKEHELAEAAIAAKEELNALRRPATPDDGKGQPVAVKEDDYWMAAEDILAEIAEAHERGIKWPCSECSGKVQGMLRKWFPLAVAAPQGWQQGAAREIDDLYTKSANSDDAGDWPTSAEVEAILKRHQEGTVK